MERSAGGAISRRAWAALCIVVALGTAFRLPGLGTAGLFYDDAWYALPGRMSLGEALRTSVTAPGATLLQAAWTDVGPSGNLWPKLLPLLIGVLAIPATFWLSRVLRTSSAVGLLMAGLVAAAPAAIEYSVRVKEYELDLLLAIALLSVTELVRRRRSPGSMVALAGTSAIAVAMSTSIFVVVAGCVASLVVIAILDRRKTKAVIGFAALAMLLCLPSLMLVAGHIPPSLTSFWISSHRLVAPPYAPGHLVRTLGLTARGMAHGLVGLPIPFQFPHALPPSRGETLVLALLAASELAMLAALCWLPISAVIRRRSDGASLSGLGAALSLVVALVAYLAGVIPLGTGRTDLVLYPSLALLLGLAATKAARRLGQKGIRRPSARRRAALAGIAILVLAPFGWHFRSWYPAQDVGTLARKIGPSLGTTDAALVEYRNSFTWAFEGLSPFSVHVARRDPRASTVGYWITFDGRGVLTEQPTGQASTRPISGLDRLPRSTSRLWVISATYSTYSPTSYRLSGQAAREIIRTSVAPGLRRSGWERSSTILHAPGVAATLWTR